MINIHNHSSFSDGAHSAEALIKAAIKAKLKIFGINDHYQTLKCPDRSLTPGACEAYVEALMKLKDKVKHKIDFKIGLEIDFCFLRTDFTTFPWELTEKLDYVLLEYVEDQDWLGMGLREVTHLRERFHCPVGLAHNDIEQNFTPDRYEELLSVMEENDLFLELCPTDRNCRGITPYYYYAEDFFVKARDRNVKFSIGTDTHVKLEEVGDITNAWDFLQHLGLGEKIIFLDGKL